MLKLSRLRGADPGPVRNNCFVRASFGASSATKDDLVIDTTAGAGDGDEDLILAAAAWSLLLQSTYIRSGRYHIVVE
jgi:hypothetical protein